MGTGRVVECGVWVEDIISDFAGVVTGVAHYINGCTSCKVESSTRKEDGEVIEQWFDVRRLRPADKDPIVRNRKWQKH